MIKLTNSEKVAYWWVKALKSATSNLEKRLETEELENEELNFFEIFSCFDVEDWRYLYTELSNEIKYFLERSRNIFQSTAAGGHNKMNRFVTRIIGQDVPDISIESKSQAIVVRDGSVIEAYDDDYKIVPSYYNENFVLTGEEKYKVNRTVAV